MARTKKYQPTEFMLPTSHYDKERADHAVNFIQSLKHTNESSVHPSGTYRQ